MSSDFTILVNSTDSFEDCWVPFFTLIKAFWPECNNQIILNTETKGFSFPGLNITCSKVGRYYKGNKRPPWGWCLKKCLEQADSNIILYLQEDYFLCKKASSSLIQEFVDYMAEHNDCAHIGITHFGSHGPFKPTNNPLLWEVDRFAEYRISLQAGLWKKDSLLKHLRESDTGWILESQGSKRAQKIDEQYLTVNRDQFDSTKKMIFPYIGTGIIKGKWYKEAVYDLFENNNIHVDYSKRGFYSEIAVEKLSFIARLSRKAKQILNSMETLMDLKINQIKITKKHKTIQ